MVSCMLKDAMVRAFWRDSVAIAPAAAYASLRDPSSARACACVAVDTVVSGAVAADAAVAVDATDAGADAGDDDDDDDDDREASRPGGGVIFIVCWISRPVVGR